MFLKRGGGFNMSISEISKFSLKRGGGGLICRGFLISDIRYHKVKESNQFYTILSVQEILRRITLDKTKEEADILLLQQKKIRKYISCLSFNRKARNDVTSVRMA